MASTTIGFSTSLVIYFKSGLSSKKAIILTDRNLTAEITQVNSFWLVSNWMVFPFPYKAKEYKAPAAKQNKINQITNSELKEQKSYEDYRPEAVKAEKTYIFESPDGGKTVYRREFGASHETRELIK